MQVALLCPPPRASGAPARPRHWPLFALSTAAALREADHRVHLHDAHRHPPDPTAAARAALAEDPDAVLLFASDYNRRIPTASLQAHVAALRSARPGLPVLLAGRHSPPEAHRLREAVPAATAVAVGEPEQSALSFLAGRGPGVLTDLSQAAVPAGMEACPKLPAWDLALPSVYGISPHQSRGEEVFPVLASRGCPYGCFFCEVRSQPAWVARPVDDVIREIVILRDRYRTRSLFLADPMFALRREDTLALLEALTPLGMRWSAMSRTDRVDPELLEAMARAGCWSLIFGVETLNPAAQQAAQKRLAPDTVGPAIRAAKAAGIEVIASAMIGLPGDDPAGVARTLDALEALAPDFAQFFEVRVPAEHAVDGGQLADHPPGAFDFDGAHFVGSGFDGPDQVRALTRSAWRRFYLRPAYLRQRLSACRARPLTELRRSVNGARIAMDRALGRAS